MNLSDEQLSRLTDLTKLIDEPAVIVIATTGEAFICNNKLENTDIIDRVISNGVRALASLGDPIDNDDEPGWKDGLERA